MPQSLVHNVDRMCWILNEATPKWAFGLAGRSGSFGEVYGDMFDHNTVVYEFENGARLYALCRTTSGCYNNGGDIIMGTKGTCHLHQCRITGETNWQYEGPRDAGTGKSKRHWSSDQDQSADQQRLSHDQRHHDHRDGTDDLLYRQRNHTRTYVKSDLQYLPAPAAREPPWTCSRPPNR